MTLSKLYGSRLLENIDVPKIPSVIMLSGNEDVSNIRFLEGDLLDANSVKLFIKRASLPENVVTFLDLATKIKPGIIQCGEGINVSNGIIDIKSISEDFILNLK